MKLARFATISAVALALVSLPAPARAAPAAKDRAAARALVTAAKGAMRQHRYDDAIAALKKADALDPSRATELALGAALVASGKLVEARRVLAAVAGTTDAGRAAKAAREAAKKALAALEPRIPTVRLEIVGPAKSEASATIDGLDVSASREVPANPGDHTVGASADGYAGAEKDVVLAEGAHAVVKLRLAAAAVKEPDAPPPLPEKKGGSRVPGVVLLSIGGAGLAAGGVLGALAFSATGAARAQCAGDACPPGAANDLSRSKLYGDASTGAFIAGGALAIAGLVLVIVAPGAAAPKDEAASARVAPWIGAGQAGITGTF
jgi:hypothetical protein